MRRLLVGLIPLVLAGGPLNLHSDLGSCHAAAMTETTPLAIVNDDTVTVVDLASLLSEIDAATQGAARAARPDPDGVLKRLIQNRLLEQEARRIELHTRPIVRNQVADLMRSEGVKALLASVIAASPAAESETATEASPIVNTMKRFSHILVPSGDLARALEDSLAAGAAFAELARRHSIDGNAARGGDLGWAARGAYVPAFEAAADTLDPGEICRPVETDFGWHLITLVEARTDTMQSAEMQQAINDSRDQERAVKQIEEFVTSLRRKYAVSVDEALLASLDYASPDQAVQNRLASSEDVLVRLPAGPLTVRALTKNIRFKNFHGISQRSDAGEVRDRVFQESLAEALLSHEAWARGFWQRPEIVSQAAQLEKRLVREEILRVLTTDDDAPSADEINSYYQTHLDRFTSAPRLRVRSVLLASEETATRFRDQLAAGADFEWLVDRTERFTAEPPFPPGWLSAAELGIDGPTLEEGSTLGPLPRDDGWAVARVVDVEDPVPAPIEECRGRVIDMIRSERVAAAGESAVRRLESDAEIEITEGATAMVGAVLERWAGMEGTRP